MTVSELIDKLRELPQDYTVTAVEETYFYEVKEVQRVDDEWQVRLS